MSITAAVLDAMVKAGCSAKQLVAAVRADEEANAEKLAEKREKDRIRQRNHRARHALSRVTERDERDKGSNGLEGSTPPKTLNSKSPSSLRSSGDAPARMEFNDFWARYPNKVGKPEALKAWLKARHKASLETILHGLDAYVHKTDDRAWCNPSTWLNQERWNDQPATVNRSTGPPGFRTSDGILAALRRNLEHDDDDESGQQPRDNENANHPLLGFAAKGHDRE